MKSRIPVLGLILVAAALPGLASAQCADPTTSTFPTHILLCPSGDIAVRCQLNDSAGNPCAGTVLFMQFNGCAGSLCPAPGQPFPVLRTTSANTGAAVFQPRIGGCCMTGSVTFYDSTGLVLATVPTVNSPDINGDCTVNLSDIALFAQAFTGAYSRCADFNMDGVLNLTDVSVIAAHFGH